MDIRLWFPLSSVLDHAEHATASDRFDTPDAGPCLLVDTTSGVTIRSHTAAAASARITAVHIDGDMSRLPASTLRLPLTHPPTAGHTPPASGPADRGADPDQAGHSLLEQMRRAAADGAAWFTVDLPTHGTPRAGVEHTRATGESPVGVSWVRAWVAAADDPRCYDAGPYPAQIAHGYRRPDGGVYARFDLDAVHAIAADQKDVPRSRIGVPIVVVDGQVRHRHPHGRGHTVPAGRDGCWHLDDPPWRWVPSAITPDSDVWQPLFDIGVDGPAGCRWWCTVCGTADNIDNCDVPSRIGTGQVDTICRCRRCGSTEVAYATFTTRAERAPWPTPRPLPVGADGAGWDGREGLPAAWWRLPADIRLQVRVRTSMLEGLMLSTDLHDGFGADGPLYLDLRHLTAWDTYQHDDTAPRRAFQALTDHFPGRFTTVGDTDRPGTVFLTLPLLYLTDQVADTILTQHRTIPGAGGIHPDTRSRSSTVPGGHHVAADQAHAAAVPDGSVHTTTGIAAAPDEHHARRPATPAPPYCTHGACTNVRHDHTTGQGPDGEDLGQPVPMRCHDCGQPAHYDEELADYRHDDPAAPGCFLIGTSPASVPVHQLRVDPAVTVGHPAGARLDPPALPDDLDQPHTDAQRQAGQASRHPLP